jgi:hypothetical protein
MQKTRQGLFGRLKVFVMPGLAATAVGPVLADETGREVLTLQEVVVTACEERREHDGAQCGESPDVCRRSGNPIRDHASAAHCRHRAVGEVLTAAQRAQRELS